MDEELFWLLLPFFIPACALLVYAISLTGWIFSKKESRRRETFGKLCRTSSKIIIGWLAFIGAITVCSFIFFAVFGIPAQQ